MPQGGDLALFYRLGGRGFEFSFRPGGGELPIKKVLEGMVRLGID